MICILTIAVGFIAVHFFKMLRLYLVLMEHRISFGRFILLYLRTTFINLIIPFKLGELYRIEEIARVTKIWQVGFLSVLVDRFFDTLALLCVLLPLDLILRGGISVITIVFLVALFVIALVYLRRTGGVALTRASFRPRRDVMWRLLSIGVPIALQDGFIQIAFIVITVIANRRGLTDAAAVGIVEKVISFVFLVPSSMLSAVSAIGAQNMARASRSAPAKRSATPHALLSALALPSACLRSLSRSQLWGCSRRTRT